MGKNMSEIEWMEIFSDNLKDIMEERGYNQITLAKDSGLSQSSINQYLNKKRVPSIRAIINMTYALGIDMSDFIDFGSMIE